MPKLRLTPIRMLAKPAGLAPRAFRLCPAAARVACAAREGSAVDSTTVGAGRVDACGGGCPAAPHPVRLEPELVGRRSAPRAEPPSAPGARADGPPGPEPGRPA